MFTDLILEEQVKQTTKLISRIPPVQATSLDLAPRPTRPKPDQVNFLLIGNPGVGKSLLLHRLTGEHKFKSGLSMNGSGLTKFLQTAKVNGINYIDSPGLDDYTSRKECAEEINRALKQGGLYFICFVLTLEAGRIRPADQTTMRLVLEAAPQIGIQYSVIVNKLEPNLYNHYLQNPNTFPNILARGFPNNLVSHSMFYFQRDEAQNPDMASFKEFLKNAPSVKIDPQQVQKIQENHWKRLFDEFEKIKQAEDQNKEKIEFTAPAFPFDIHPRDVRLNYW